MYEEVWWVENRVRYTRFVGGDALKDVFEIDHRLVGFLDASPHPIHFVIDVTDLTASPSLEHGLNMRHLRHPNTGWVIVVGGSHNSVVRFIASITFKLFGTKYKDCATPAAALDFLRQVDPELADAYILA